MSLILDALRKIEQERRTKRQGGGDIRADVLSYQGSSSPSHRKRQIPLLVGLTLGCAVAVALFFFFKQGQPVAVTGQPVPTAAVIRPAAEPAMEPVPSPPAARRAEAPQKAAVTPAIAPTPSLPAGDGGEKLLVSGIAWQEERGLRRAVVNGVLAGEGAEILGARIIEIRENLVRFSRNGRIFEVNYPGGAGR